MAVRRKKRMVLHKEYADPAKDPGDRLVLGEDPDLKAEVSLIVRRIPEDQEKAFRKQFRTQRHKVVRYRKGTQEMDVDTEAERARAAARAAFALVDSENLEVLPGDEGAAKAYSELLGFPVPVGQPLRLDGRWTPELREHYLAKH